MIQAPSMILLIQHVPTDGSDDVSTRIANALNAALSKYGVVGLGDTEFAHWCRILLQESSWQTSSLAQGGMA